MGDMYLEAETIAASPFHFLAAASVLGLLLGLASGPQPALASAQAGQGTDLPMRPGIISQRQRDMIHLSQIEKTVKEMKVDVARRANAPDRAEKVKAEMAKLHAIAAN